MLQARSSDPASRAEITTVLLALIDSFAAPLRARRDRREALLRTALNS